MARKFLGILGGMGSVAGAYLLERVLHHTPARKDQEHLEILLYSNPTIPDRTEDILGLGPSAEPELIRSIQLLESTGVACISIACVTAHHYIESMRARVQPPVLSIIEETAMYLDEYFPGKNRIGLLATTGTIRAGIFQKEFDRRSLKTIVLPEEAQENLIMEAIYGERGIKSGSSDDHNGAKLLEASKMLIEDGAEVIVAGCTEIPLILSGKVFDVSVIDTLDVLAIATVTFCWPAAGENSTGV